ncbi:response regulator [Flavobacterium sedimenticola]|uniref:Response regulator n=1 Tax=Flavobacterium sedimenticola TaxID=3043286 RepID=A0ABT6XNY9_9FLAO|nr:response regulator [Flavobacterium sedimenticola]MDI9256811.1 response regulator [Flavobacterium sedimenticola]
MMNKKIILIDDDEIYQFITIKALTKLDDGVRIFSCLNGKAGLDKLLEEYSREEHFVVLLDLNMPVMNGWEFIQEFEKHNLHHNGNIEVYIVSSSTDQIDIKKAEQFVCVKAFLSKPIPIDKYDYILKGNG